MNTKKGATFVFQVRPRTHKTQRPSLEQEAISPEFKQLSLVIFGYTDVSSAWLRASPCQESCTLCPALVEPREARHQAVTFRVLALP